MLPTSGRVRRAPAWHSAFECDPEDIGQKDAVQPERRGERHESGQVSRTDTCEHTGAWGKLSLWDTVSELHSRWRYRCYWQGDVRHSGALVPIHEACSSNISHFWSNIVCAKEHHILRVFDEMLPDYMGGHWRTNATLVAQSHMPWYKQRVG